MANSTIRIVFSALSDPAGTGTAIEGQVANFSMFHNTTINVQETFIKLRVQPFQTTMCAPPDYITGTDEKPTFLWLALVLDYPSLFAATVDGDDAVLVTSLFPNTIFTGGVDTPYLSYVVNNIIAPTTAQPMKVLGLNDDRYLINNPISVYVASLENPIYFKFRFSNLSNQLNTTDFIAYPDTNGSATINIESIIKSIFNYPSDVDGYVIPNELVPNSNKIKIQMYYNGFDIGLNQQTGELLGFEVIKTFIRGGKRTSQSNQSLTGLQILTPSEKLPVWTGYDTAEYYLDENNLIRKRLLMDVPQSRIDSRRSKGCNEVYVKFLNQNGGYSNWLFESFANKEDNKNLGGFVRKNQNDDLGSEVDNKRTCFAKVPKEYKDMIADLIVSPEIYAMKDGVFERVRSISNSITYDNIKRSYQVNISFDPDYRFNPSLLWSN